MSRARVFYWIYLFAILLLINACSDNVRGSKEQNSSTSIEGALSDSLSKEEFVRWYQEHEMSFQKERVFDGVFIKAKYIPHQLQYFKQGEIYNRSLKDYGELEYYTLTFGLNQSKKDFLKSGFANLDYQALVEYLSFKIGGDLFLEVAGQKLPCEYSVFERSFGITPFVTLNLGFRTSDQAGDRKIVYHDKIMSLGIVKLQVTDKESINMIPHVKI